MLNRIVLIGRVATDPELKYTPSGIAVSTFRLAVTRSYKSADGEKEADFIDIVAWRQQAEFTANYLSKGRLTAVEGRLQIRQYTASDGSKRRVSEVVADSVQGLDRPKDDASAPAASSQGEEGGGDAAAYVDPFQDE